jgi:hypothetical protein
MIDFIVSNCYIAITDTKKGKKRKKLIFKFYHLTKNKKKNYSKRENIALFQEIMKSARRFTKEQHVFITQPSCIPFLKRN